MCFHVKKSNFYFLNHLNQESNFCSVVHTEVHAKLAGALDVMTHGLQTTSYTDPIYKPNNYNGNNNYQRSNLYFLNYESDVLLFYSFTLKSKTSSPILSINA